MINVDAYQDVLLYFIHTLNGEFVCNSPPLNDGSGHPVIKERLTLKIINDLNLDKL